MDSKLSEQEIVRRKKKEELENIGINPFPSNSINITSNTSKILSEFDKFPENFKNISIAGRLTSKRIMGSASFAELMDSHGKIQLYFHRDSICPTEDKNLYNNVFKKLIDIGDILSINGYAFKTKVGQVSIHVEKFDILTKSLRPLPIVKETQEGSEKTIYDAFSNPEARYRQRYVDLLVNNEVKQIFEKRSKIIKILRRCFDEINCLEVETPILQPIYGGALAKPFITHYNSLDEEFYLRISNELYLKRLIVGGYPGVYEFAKLFRNEGMSRYHNPEFSSVEIYVAYKDYLWMMDYIEKVLEKVVLEINDSYELQYENNIINFSKPWKRIKLFDAIKKFTSIDISEMDETDLRKTAEKLNLKIDNTYGKGKIIDEIFSKKCEPHFINPTIIMDYPIEMSPLAKKHQSNSNLVERFEVICNGKEIINSYSELNDPLDQKQRFENQYRLGKKGDEETMIIDNDFLRALEYGMPPTVGLGIGIDRLTMLLTGATSIQEVIFFPHMKKQTI